MKKAGEMTVYWPYRSMSECSACVRWLIATCKFSGRQSLTPLVSVGNYSDIHMYILYYIMCVSYTCIILHHVRKLHVETREHLKCRDVGGKDKGEKEKKNN